VVTSHESSGPQKIAFSELLVSRKQLRKRSSAISNEKTNMKTITLKKLNLELLLMVSAVSTAFKVHNCLNTVIGKESNPTPADGIITPENPRPHHQLLETRDAAHEALMSIVQEKDLVKTLTSIHLKSIFLPQFPWKRYRLSTSPSPSVLTRCRQRNCTQKWKPWKKHVQNPNSQNHSHLPLESLIAITIIPNGDDNKSGDIP
jgi:hypothetical protein